MAYRLSTLTANRRAIVLMLHKCVILPVREAQASKEKNHQFPTPMCTCAACPGLGGKKIIEHLYAGVHSIPPTIMSIAHPAWHSWYWRSGRIADRLTSNHQEISIDASVRFVLNISYKIIDTTFSLLLFMHTRPDLQSVTEE